MSNTPRRKAPIPKHLKRLRKKMRKATNTNWKLSGEPRTRPLPRTHQ